MKASTNTTVRNILVSIIIAVVVVAAVIVVPDLIASAKEMIPDCSGIVC